MLMGREHFYPHFKDAVEWAAASGPSLDAGTTHKFRKELEPFRSSLEGHYVALDLMAQPDFGALNVDVDGDVCALPFREGSFGSVFSIGVLCHVADPYAALSEMGRVLVPGGRLVLTTPFNSGYLGKEGDYPDYFRYTDEGLRLLAKGFSKVEVIAMGGPLYPLLFKFFSIKNTQRILRSGFLMKIFNALDRRKSTSHPQFWLLKATK